MTTTPHREVLRRLRAMADAGSTQDELMAEARKHVQVDVAGPTGQEGYAPRALPAKLNRKTRRKLASGKGTPGAEGRSHKHREAKHRSVREARAVRAEHKIDNARKRKALESNFELDRESDGRWPAEATNTPGCAASGATGQIALGSAQAIENEVKLERLAHNESGE